MTSAMKESQLKVLIRQIKKQFLLTKLMSCECTTIVYHNFAQRFKKRGKTFNFFTERQNYCIIIIAIVWTSICKQNQLIDTDYFNESRFILQLVRSRRCRINGMLRCLLTMIRNVCKTGCECICQWQGEIYFFYLF